MTLMKRVYIRKNNFTVLHDIDCSWKGKRKDEKWNDLEMRETEREREKGKIRDENCWKKGDRNGVEGMLLTFLYTT